MLVDFKQKSQITIPKELVKKLNLKVGDKFDAQVKDGKLVLTPVIIVPKEQGWYYSAEWQEKEKKVDQQIKEGEISCCREY
jgi:antitoxin MazE